MKSYLREMGPHLGKLSRSDRVLALEGLEAQLSELLEAGIDPVEALGTPEDYAGELLDALASDASADEPHLRVLGLPLETRGLVSAKVRSRMEPGEPTPRGPQTVRSRLDAQSRRSRRETQTHPS